MIRIDKVRGGVQTRIIARSVIGLPAIKVLRVGLPVQSQALTRINPMSVRRASIAT